MIDCTSRCRTTSRSLNLHERNSRRVAEHDARFLQSRQLAAGQIDLRDVAGDHGLRVVAEPRQEHLHLLGGRVLRLVEDDERVVERAPAHERERRDFDRPALEHPPRAIEIHHVVQRVVERAQVRIHFLGEVAGQEAELLAGFDRGPAQHHPRDLVLHQRRQRHRHRKVGLAGAGGADAENDIVVANRVDIDFLVDALGRDDALVGRDVNRVEKNIFQLGVAIAANNSNRVLDVARIDRVAVLQQIVNLADHLARERLLGVRAGNSE